MMRGALPFQPEFVTPYLDRLHHVQHQIGQLRNLLPPEMHAEFGRVPVLTIEERSGLETFVRGHESELTATLHRDARPPESINSLLLYLESGDKADIPPLLHVTSHVVGLARQESLFDPQYGGALVPDATGLPIRPMLEWYPPVVNGRRLMIELYENIRARLVQEAARW